MFQAFFIHKLQRDLALNLQWVDFLETKEDELTDEIRLAASKIINSHHIWNCRLRKLIAESDLMDVMPQLHWKQLLQANSRETIVYLDDFSSEEKIRFHDSEGVQLEQLSVDLLFQLLQDNSFHRGQLVLLCEKQGWDFNLSL
ncbi:MAG: hypothetical protein A3D31_06530 [Candidatus Fluviicola riflensis]|nr:MAG: hypothetical protein CHH17_08480 [Candidatus Fluviicola riflensis]OGS79617.1 MAG: hypothetical protein A3D31_06530 [Candidatus Fluviicola riflensis]OGS87048.1 MAG: hypothetical protein A2724_05990 [Fluviicola sp. RIFCSPHIGHO2_01_FULL_43_53]OGS89840.1 MAG: hypothetical protein A3E30_02740 [Fluviicola sp. RIFCSPHIGHO2_12_FULL_43_24]